MRKVVLLIAVLAISFAVLELGDFSGDELEDISLGDWQSQLYEQKLFTHAYKQAMQEVSEVKSSKLIIEGGTNIVKKSEIKAEAPRKTSHTVAITWGGFVPDELHLKKGDTVTWVHERGDTRLKEAALNGIRSCYGLVSGFLYDGDTYAYTFEEKGTCTIVDTISLYQTMEVYIE